jgi:HEPN domain-containing protein
MSRKYAKEWRQKAEEDYLTIVVLSRQRKRRLPDVICFHGQQCVEKYLKALLAKHNIKVPKSHDLEFLTDQLRDAEPL